MEIFRDKVAIVTGAASGIGRALSAELARRGAVVVMADVNAGMLEEAVGSITAAGGRAHAALLDVTDAAGVKKLVDDTAASHGRLDYLFNNAGIGVMGDAHEFSIEDWRRVIDVNLYGVVHGVAAAYPLMVRQGFGHIVNTASMAGLVPATGEISYVASKYGIVGLSNALRLEAAPLSVRVSVVCPGIIDTPIFYTTKLINADREKVLGLRKWMMSPEQCARVILRGVEKNRATIVVTAMAKAFWWLQRFSPWLMGLVWAFFMKKLREARTED
ncbi:MAG TPA: SDR family NAD(P)-dependent oxidoreductase [bacterium]|nr:SDR family NAD(P)-dependent oxidoreductase [bacterium]